jgi:hypothetical protein
MLRGGDLVVMLVHGQAHFEHRRDHLAADVHRAVDRRNREISALGARPVAEVTNVIFAARVGRQLDIVDAIIGAVVAVLEADVVEHEEFGLGADIDGVADTGGLEIGLSTLRSRARIAAVKLAGARLDDVAEGDHHRSRREGIHIDGVQIRLEDHVALVDRLPALDRGAVEHQAVVECILIDHARTHRQVLPLALRVGEAKIDPFDLLVLDHAQNLASIVGHVELPPWSSRYEGS